MTTINNFSIQTKPSPSCLTYLTFISPKRVGERGVQLIQAVKQCALKIIEAIGYAIQQSFNWATNQAHRLCNFFLFRNSIVLPIVKSPEPTLKVQVQQLIEKSKQEVNISNNLSTVKVSAENKKFAPDTTLKHNVSVEPQETESSSIVKTDIAVETKGADVEVIANPPRNVRIVFPTRAVEKSPLSTAKICVALAAVATLGATIASGIYYREAISAQIISLYSQMPSLFGK